MPNHPPPPPGFTEEVHAAPPPPPGFTEAVGQAPQGKSVGGFVNNIGKSAANFAGGIASAVTHPIDTITNVGDVVQGGMLKGMKAIGIPGELDDEEKGKIAKADALGQHYKDRYGSLEKVGNTLYNDPVGAASDVSMVAGGAGAALAAGGAGKWAQVANKVSQAANPMVGPIRAAKATVKAVVPKTALNNMALKQYEGGLKPPPSWNSVDDTRAMMETAMDEGVKLPFVGTGTGAITKTRGKIDGINQQVANTIKQGAAAGKTADPAKVAAETGRTLGKVKDFANPRTARQTVGNVTSEFLEEHAGATPQNPTGNPIPLDKAQAVKSATYKQIRDANFGEFKTVEKEALKDIARGLKNEVYAAYPELKELGMKEKALIDLEDALERFALRQGNRDNVQLGTMAAGAIGGGKVALVKAALDNPGVKSRFAIALRKASQAPKNTPAKPARIRQGLNAAPIVGLPKPRPIEESER